jgi:hypothetical protein
MDPMDPLFSGFADDDLAGVDGDLDLGSLDLAILDLPEFGEGARRRQAGAATAVYSQRGGEEDVGQGGRGGGGGVNGELMPCGVLGVSSEQMQHRTQVSGLFSGYPNQ